MATRRIALALAPLLAAALSTSIALAAWQPSGVPLCATCSGDFRDPGAAADGAGGVFGVAFNRLARDRRAPRFGAATTRLAGRRPARSSRRRRRTRARRAWRATARAASTPHSSRAAAYAHCTVFDGGTVVLAAPHRGRGSLAGLASRRGGDGQHAGRLA